MKFRYPIRFQQLQDSNLIAWKCVCVWVCVLVNFHLQITLARDKAENTDSFSTWHRQDKVQKWDLRNWKVITSLRSLLVHWNPRRLKGLKSTRLLSTAKRQQRTEDVAVVALNTFVSRQTKSWLLFSRNHVNRKENKVWCPDVWGIKLNCNFSSFWISTLIWNFNMYFINDWLQSSLI